MLCFVQVKVLQNYIKTLKNIYKKTFSMSKIFFSNDISFILLFADTQNIIFICMLISVRPARLRNFLSANLSRAAIGAVIKVKQASRNFFGGRDND